MSEEINSITVAVKELGSKIEKMPTEMLTKAEGKKYAEAIADLSKAMDRKALEEKTDTKTIFANKAQARDFIDCMKSALDRSNSAISRDSNSPFHMEKTAGDPITGAGTNAGSDLIPTATSDTFSMLLAQGAVNRQYCTVYSGLQGDIILPKRSGTSTAVFTAAEDTAVTATQLGTAKVTLSPKQISTLSLVSDKALYASAVNIANIVALDLIEQTGVLEDTALVAGDGGAGYGSVTGLNTASGLGVQSAVYSAWTLNDVLNLQSKVHESVYRSANARYFMSGAFFNLIQQLTATSSGVYHFNPSTQSFQLGGYDIVIWHRMDNAVAAGKYPVYFGDMAKAVVVGTGRDMSLNVDTSFKFGTNQTCFRLTEDWQAQTIQGSAMARLRLTT